MLIDRYRGALLGLAAGDALGTTVEFRPPGTFDPLTDIVGGGPFDLAAGEWTDDTSMALCLAESLLERTASIPSTSCSATSAGFATDITAAPAPASTSATRSATLYSASSAAASRGAAAPIRNQRATAP